MKCHNCGEKLEKDGVFCTNCGTKIEVIKKSKFNNPKVYIPIIVISVLAILSVSVFAGVTLKNKAQDEQLRREIEERVEKQKAEDDAGEVERPVVEDQEEIVKPSVKEELLYFSTPDNNLGGGLGYNIYKMNTDDLQYKNVFKSDDYVRSWAIIDETIAYASDSDWEMLDRAIGPNYAGEIGHNNFLNAIYSINEDGTDEKCIVKGDIYDMHEESKSMFGDENMVHFYEVLFTHKGWIYFQSNSGVYATGGFFLTANLSKIRPDGTGLTKVSDGGFQGEFTAIKDGWAYFNSSEYGGDFTDIERLNLKTGEIENLMQDASIAGMLGDKLYYHLDHMTGVYSLDIKTGEQEVITETDNDGDLLIYLEGNQILQWDYEYGTRLLHTLDLTREQINSIDFRGYGLKGANKNGYKYYADEQEDSELYKMDLNTGSKIALTENLGYVESIKVYD